MSSFIKIEKLTCVRLNNRDGYECQLEILIDRSIKKHLQMILSAGQSWSSNHQYYQFENQVEVRMLDKNEQGNECFSGLVNLKLNPVHQNLKAFIDNEIGYYILDYRIELEKPPKLLSPPKLSNGNNKFLDGIVDPPPTPD